MKDPSFDIAGLVVMCVLILSIVFRKMTKGITNRIFIASVICGALGSAFDIFAINVDNSGTTNEALICLAHSMYLVFHVGQAPLHMLFVVSLTDTWHKIKKNIPMLALIGLPYTAILVLIVINPFTHILFTTQGGYAHSKLFNLTYVSVFIYIVSTFVYVIKYRWQFNLRKVLSLCSMAFMVAIAVIVHMSDPLKRVECFVIAVSLLIVSVGIQRPEDFIDTFTNLYKQSAYANDLRRTFMLDKHVNIVMLNIANFLVVQNMIGYDNGNLLLAEIARRIEAIGKSFKCGCMVYYLDRGRFRMVFNQEYRHEAELAAQYVLNDLKTQSKFKGFDISLTPFIVLSRCPEEIESFKSLMAFGNDFHDKHLYTGRVVLASEIYNAKEFVIQNNIEKIIDRGFENNSFKVFYQPIYSTEQGRFVSAEALIRLFDVEHGFVSPELLITAAEKSGAIHRIGNFVFEEVCRFIASDEYKKLGLDYIEVNLSVAQCMDSDLADNILGIMKKYNVSASQINLEITETAASYTQRVMTENLNKLSQAGLLFSLDDYGTGYSNMKRVISLPLKIVKLDKSFVDDINNPKMWIFLHNTVKMLKDMEMEIVVEGIETKEMLDTFSNMKCDFIQGYFFSKPISKDDFVAFIMEAHKQQELPVN